MDSDRKSVKTLELLKKMRENYSKIPQDNDERVMEQIEKLLISTPKSLKSINEFLQETAFAASRLSGFMEVLIALKTKGTDMFKYQAFVGFRKDVEYAISKREFFMKDMFDQKKYPCFDLTDFTKFYPAEWKPYTEDELNDFNRPTIISTERSSDDEFLEGDYFCVFIYGPRKELMGWLELSRTRDGKFPSRKTMKWLELISSIIGRECAGF